MNLLNVVRQRVHNFLNAACTGNLDLLKSKFNVWVLVVWPLVYITWFYSFIYLTEVVL